MNTLFLRLEALLQCYVTTDKYNGRSPLIYTQRYPSKSAIIGLLSGAIGVRRHQSVETLSRLNTLLMGVRIDREGVLIEDFQIANPPLITAEGGVSKSQDGAMLTGKNDVREYIADASFLVALQGSEEIIELCVQALDNPVFPLYYGRKFCTPLMPPFVGTGNYSSLDEALPCPWAAGWGPNIRRAIVERSSPTPRTFVSSDVLVNCHPFVHGSRLVESITVPVEPINVSLGCMANPSFWGRIRRETAHTKKMKEARRKKDNWLCVVCKMRAKESHHVTYVRYGEEDIDDLRSLCDPCHNAVTGMEYDLNMVLNRIDPLDSYWKNKILAHRPKFS